MSGTMSYHVTKRGLRAAMNDKEWIRELEREVKDLAKEVRELKNANEQLRYDNERLRDKVGEMQRRSAAATSSQIT